MNLDKITIIRDPVYAIIFDDFFDDDINKDIMKEAIKNQKQFKYGTIGYGDIGRSDSKYRTNIVSFYDQIYEGKREDSVLLKNIDKTLQSDEMREILSSSQFPINMYSLTNTHETQVSRYGDEQFYKWHLDNYFGSTSRIITLVYYFNNEPVKFEGGELSLTNSPSFHDKLIEKNPNILDIEPKNNRAIVFASNTEHSVKPVKNKSYEFEDGRFSANCWIGIKQ